MFQYLDTLMVKIQTQILKDGNATKQNYRIERKRVVSYANRCLKKKFWNKTKMFYPKCGAHPTEVADRLLRS